VDGGLWTVRHYRLSRDVRQLRGRGAQIHLGPPESQGSGGAVPRPTKGGFPRPKLETAYVPRLRRRSSGGGRCAFELLDIGGDPQQQLLCYVATREAATASDGEALSEPCPGPSCAPIPG
jgi:hypothetical protein